METLMPAPGAAAAIARWLILASMLVAVATGCWLLSAQSAAAAALAAGPFLLAAIGGRLWPLPTAAAVMALAAVHYGILRLPLGPTLAAMPAWLAAFSGLVVGLSVRGGWQSPPAWRIPLAWWAAGVALSWPIVLAREMDFVPDGPRATIPLIVPSALIQMSVALWIDWLIAQGIKPNDTAHDDRPTPDSRLPTPGIALLRAVAAGALVSALAAIYQRFVDPSWLSGPPWSTDGRSVGMMGDANPLGVLTAMLAPLAAGGLVAGNRSAEARASALLTSAGWIAAAILWAAAWFSGARSMIIISAAGVAGLLLHALRARLGAARAAAIIVALGIAAALAVAAIAARAGAGTPLERLVRHLPSTSAADAAYELLWRRDGYGLAAVQAVRDRPLNGVGIGTFTPWSPAYFREAGGTHPIPGDNAQNLWRHVAAERGLLGLLPILWLTALTIAAIARRGPIVLRAILAGIGATLFFGLPVQDAGIAAVLGLLVGTVAGVPHEGSARGFRATVPHQGWSFAAILGVSLVAAGLDLAAARGDLSLPARAARFGVPYSRGFGDQEPAPDGSLARAFRESAVLVRPAATGRFSLRGWVRAPGGDARIRIWSGGRLVFDVVIPDGGTFAHTIQVPAGARSVWLTFSASRGDALVTGTFEETAAR